MKIRLLTTLFFTISISMCGCGPSFEIVKANDKFDSPGIESWMGKNNRITNRSTTRGWHIDDKGMYLNPYVEMDRPKNKLRIRLFFQHWSSSLDLLFMPLNKMIFLIDNKDRVEINFRFIDSDFKVNSWNNITNEYNTNSYESAVAGITSKDYLRISNSSSLSIKLIGQKKVFVIENEDLESEFIANLKKFGENHIPQAKRN